MKLASWEPTDSTIVGQQTARPTLGLNTPEKKEFQNQQDNRNNLRWMASFITSYLNLLQAYMLDNVLSNPVPEMNTKPWVSKTTSLSTITL